MHVGYAVSFFLITIHFPVLFLLGKKFKQMQINQRPSHVSAAPTEPRRTLKSDIMPRSKHQLVVGVR